MKSHNISYYQVLPVIIPFNFGEDELNIDESVSTMCSVTKGDQPLNIWWTFNDYSDSFNLSSNDGIIVSRNSQKVSSLLIEAVKARHRGNYTCYAKNRAGMTSHAAYLAING